MLAHILYGNFFTGQFLLAPGYLTRVTSFAKKTLLIRYSPEMMGSQIPPK